MINACLRSLSTRLLAARRWPTLNKPYVAADWLDWLTDWLTAAVEVIVERRAAAVFLVRPRHTRLNSWLDTFHGLPSVHSQQAEAQNDENPPTTTPVSPPPSFFYLSRSLSDRKSSSSSRTHTHTHSHGAMGKRKGGKEWNKRNEEERRRIKKKNKSKLLPFSGSLKSTPTKWGPRSQSELKPPCVDLLSAPL